MAIPERVTSLAAIASLTLLLPIEASAARDPAEYPLRVHVIRTRWRTCPGGFTIVVRKPGFRTWERKLQLAGGDIRVSADLEEGSPK